MKITFVQGYSYVFKMLLNELGYEAVVPPEPSKGLSTWCPVCTEFACILFKVPLGTYGRPRDG